MFNKDRVSLRRNSSVFFSGFLLLAIAGLAFFLASGFVFEKKIEVLHTALQEEKTVIGSGTLAIESWIFDEETDEMEVVLATDQVKTIDNELVFAAFQRNGNGEKVPIETVFQQDGIYVLRIMDLHDSFQQLALDVIAESTDLFADKEAETTEQPAENKRLIMTIYADQRMVTHGEVLKKTNAEYTAFLSDLLVANVERETARTQEAIENEQQKREKLRSEIQVYEEQMVYETADEKVETENIINGFKRKIDESIQSAEDLEAKIGLLNEKKQKLLQRKQELEL